MLTVLQVNIEISYSSPDLIYSPPNYRAATPVTLTCVASGTTGSVSYRWTSTCRSCFASSSSSSTISKEFLVARDAGVHTCSVTDSSGNRGSNQTTMNIAGMSCNLTQWMVFSSHLMVYQLQRDYMSLYWFTSDSYRWTLIETFSSCFPPHPVKWVVLHLCLWMYFFCLQLECKVFYI